MPPQLHAASITRREYLMLDVVVFDEFLTIFGPFAARDAGGGLWPVERLCLPKHLTPGAAPRLVVHFETHPHAEIAADAAFLADVARKLVQRFGFESAAELGLLGQQAHWRNSLLLIPISEALDSVARRPA